MRVKVVGTGFHAPERVETSQELAPRVGRSEEWIHRRAGVRSRRISEEPLEVMGARAARMALADGGPPDLVICAGASAVQLIPDNAVFLIRELGLEAGTPGFSVHATCLSFMVGLSTAAALVHAGAYRRVLVVSAEQGSRCRNFDEPESAVLIGDGAGAAVLEATPSDQDSELLAYRMRTWPEGAGLAEIRGFGSRHHPNDPATQPSDNLFHMRGPRLVRLTWRIIAPLLQDLFDQTGLSPDDLDCIVPHQASRTALDALPRLGLPGSKVIDLVADYGNCVAASLPMGLALAESQGRLKRGDRVLLLGAGAGVSVAGALLRW